MALKPLLSFSSGELDPILTDNVTLEKFNKGLATARNVMIGKTGSILSRFSTTHFAEGRLNNRAIKLYKPRNSDFLLEWGHQYVRVYDLLDNTYTDLSHHFLESDLPNLHFETSKNFVYAFCAGKKLVKVLMDTSASSLVADADIFKVPMPFDFIAVYPAGGPTGYKVDYLVTLIVNGEETLHIENVTGFNKPIAAGQFNRIEAQWNNTDIDLSNVSEMRVYSRPHEGGAYGYLGSTTKFSSTPPSGIGVFDDIGSLPDYANGIQDLITKTGLDGKAILALNPKTGFIYQQRLGLTTDDDKEAIIVSRPGFQNNFFRDFPYASDSALKFKAGTSGRAEVLRVIDSDGLAVFTTNGVYTNSGVLNVNNLALSRKGSWVINDKIPPLLVPGGLFFVDESNVIRHLVFSQDIMAYESPEQTIFSNHLFKTRTITSWCYQKGLVPVIIVTFSDGTWATFTFNAEHQMRAWTRHDSKYPVEQVETGDGSDSSFFVINKDGTRYIEKSIPRVTSSVAFVSNPELDKNEYSMFADSIFTLGSAEPLEGLDISITPVTPGEWDGLLDLEHVDSSGAPFVPGEIIRFFNPSDKSVVDLLVVTSDTTNTIVEPSDEFPSEYSVQPTLYSTFASLFAPHLANETVSVMVDGSLVTSPYNDIEGYPEIVANGSGLVTLPSGMRGAFINVGRPIIADTETLNISTVEQSPTLIESVNVNKLYIRVNETRGLYCSNKFPKGNGVKGMDSLDETLVPEEDDLIGNTYLPAVSRRIEKHIPGSWDSQGKIAIRQVDPYHFEILSIIPDLTVLSRSDR